MENKETRKTTMFCLKHTDSKRGTYFSDFYNHKTALAVCYGASYDQIYTVCVEEVKKRAGDYWGWWCFAENRFALVFGNRNLLNMCFPYGIDAAEKKGEWIALPVKINENVQRQ